MDSSVKIIPKPWGREVLFAAEPEYVGKILEIKGGHQLSLQYHTKKKETMYFLCGKVELTVDGKTEEIHISKAVTILPGVKHRIKALSDSKILEVSTNHLNDVIRLEDDYNRI